MLMCVILLALPTFISAAVPDKPTWTVVPPHYLDGTNVTLTCKSASTTTTFTLYKGDKPFTNSANAVAVVNANDAVITFSPYRSSSHDDSYKCRAYENADASIENGTVVVEPHILKPTLKVTTPAASAAYTDGDTVNITCHTTTSGVTYSFTKNGAAATDHVDGGNKIFAPYRAATDAGTYKCKASKDSLEVESEALTLVVGNSAVQMMISTIILSMCLLVASVIY